MTKRVELQYISWDKPVPENLLSNSSYTILSAVYMTQVACRHNSHYDVISKETEKRVSSLQVREPPPGSRRRGRIVTNWTLWFGAHLGRIYMSLKEGMIPTALHHNHCRRLLCPPGSYLVQYTSTWMPLEHDLSWGD